MAELEEFNAGIGCLVEAMSVLGTSKVPLPAIFTGIDGPIDIASFFVAFERYCLVNYKKDLLSWVQVLPSFLEGEAREIAQAFGCGAKYALVKQKLVEEFSYGRTLGRTLVAKFLSAERRAGETLRVYSIRLGELARGAFGAEIGSRDDMIKSKVLASLPSKMVQQINVQLGHLSESSLEQVVRLAILGVPTTLIVLAKLLVTRACHSCRAFTGIGIRIDRLAKHFFILCVCTGDQDDTFTWRRRVP